MWVLSSLFTFIARFKLKLWQFEIWSFLEVMTRAIILFSEAIWGTSNVFTCELVFLHEKKLFAYQRMHIFEYSEFHIFITFFSPRWHFQEASRFLFSRSDEWFSRKVRLLFFDEEKIPRGIDMLSLVLGI